MRASRQLPVVPISFLIILFALTLSHHLFVPASATVTPHSVADGGAGLLAARACSRAARHDPNVKAPFCAAALKEAWLASHIAGGSKRRSRRPFPRTLTGVAELSVRAALLNATATAAAIRRMLLPGGKAAAGRDRAARACVQDCLELYSGAADGLRDSVRAVSVGRIGDAQSWISAALDAPGTCDDGFTELAERRAHKGRHGRTWNPLRRNDKDLFQLSAMALTFISFLQN